MCVCRLYTRGERSWRGVAWRPANHPFPFSFLWEPPTRIQRVQTLPRGELFENSCNYRCKPAFSPPFVSSSSFCLIYRMYIRIYRHIGTIVISGRKVVRSQVSSARQLTKWHRTSESLEFCLLAWKLGADLSGNCAGLGGISQIWGQRVARKKHMCLVEFLCEMIICSFFFFYSGIEGRKETIILSSIEKSVGWNERVLDARFRRNNGERLIRVQVFEGGAIRIVLREGSREAGTIIRLSCHVAADGIMIMPRIRRIRERKCERWVKWRGRAGT